MTALHRFFDSLSPSEQGLYGLAIILVIFVAIGLHWRLSKKFEAMP